MVVNEIFHSIQGEGLLAGTPSVFIRLAGCPLRCVWCDTKYAWDANEGEELPIPEIINRIVHWPCRFVVITGGEPMVNPQLPDLAKALKERNKHITIETAGIKFVAGLACDLMSVSPKLSNSVQAGEAPSASSPANGLPGQATHAHRQVSLTEIQYLSSLKQLIRRYPYQLKFVVDSPDDLPEIQQAIEQIGGVSAEKVMLMPQAKKREELIAKSPMVAQMCKETGYVFCQRLHILLYDGAKGK